MYEKCDASAKFLIRNAPTVLSHCPISAEIRIVDSQSDLRTLQ